MANILHILLISLIVNFTLAAIKFTVFFYIYKGSTVRACARKNLWGLINF